MEQTVRIIDCIRIIKIHVDVFRVVLEDEPFAVLVGDQGNHLIAQLGQESAENEYRSQLDDSYRRRGNMYRINVVRFLAITPDVLSSQVVSSGQKMMYTRPGWKFDERRRYNPG